MKRILLLLLTISSLSIHAQRRQFVWQSVMKNGTPNMYAGWDASGNPVEKTAAGSGITNTAANLELGMSNGTNIVPSGIFKTSTNVLSFGGSSSPNTFNQIIADGSAASVSLEVAAKGASGQLTLTGKPILFSTGIPLTLSGGVFTTNSSDCGFIIGTTPSAATKGYKISLTAGQGNLSSGTNDGGDVVINSGTKGLGGKDGNIILNAKQSAVTGYILLQNLPTAVTGLPSGVIWNNAGVLSIAP